MTQPSSLRQKFFITILLFIMFNTVILIASEIPTQSSYSALVHNMRKYHQELSLRHAVKSNNIPEIEYLIKQNININAQDKNTGDTALHEAAYQNNSKVTHLLLAHNADVNIQNKKRNSPLHVSAYKKNLEITIVLLNNNANVNIQNSDGDAPLHFAAYKDSVEIARVLLNNNANVNIQNYLGNTPLHEVIFKAQNKELLLLLLKNGANPIIKNKNQYLADSYLANTIGGVTPQDGIDRTKNKFISSTHAILLCAHLERITKIKPRNEKLFDAARCNDIKKLTNLLNKGAEINYQDVWFKDTALHTAAFYGNLEIMKFLLEKGAHIDIQNRMGNTALHVAMKHQKLKIVFELLNHKANSIVKNERSYYADKYFKYLIIERAASPAKSCDQTDSKKEIKKMVLSIHAHILSAHLVKIIEKDENIIIEKDTLPAMRNS